MKHYHRNIAESVVGYWSSHEYFQREWKKLDPQPGECFALFKNRKCLKAVILAEKLVPGFNYVHVQCKMISLEPHGFQRYTGTFDVCDLESYSDIVQIAPRRFHVLDKQIAMLNVQINAYKCELEKLLTN